MLHITYIYKHIDICEQYRTIKDCRIIRININTVYCVWVSTASTLIESHQLHKRRIYQVAVSASVLQTGQCIVTIILV